MPEATPLDAGEISRALIQASPEAVIAIDAAGDVTVWNPAAERIFGWSEAEALGRPLPNVPPEGWEEHLRSHERLLGGGPGLVAVEVMRVRRDGSRVPVSLSTAPMRDAEGRIRGVMSLCADLTERARAEEVRRQLAAIVESTGDAVLSKALDGTVLSWNRGAERIYGYTAEEMIGGPISRLFPPELLSEEAAFVFKLARGERIQGYETVRMRRDGMRIHVSLTISPMVDEAGEIVSASIIVRDITEAKRAEAELRASHERYRLAGRAAKDVIWDWDLLTDRIEWGDAVHTTFGYAPEQVQGDLPWWAERIHRDDLEGVSASLSDFLAGSAEEWSHEYRFRRGDGSWACVLDRRYAIRSPAGITTRMIGSLTEITQQRENEAALRRAKEAAEAASRSKSEFLSAMSHELRTPLNSVIGFTNILRKNRAGNLREQDLAYLDRIQANGMHLLGLINDVLDLSKIEAGKMRVELAPAEVDRLVHETLNELQGNLARGVELRVAVPERLAPLETDRRKLKQILINLVGNALKFTEAGSVSVTVEADPVTRRPTRIDVADTGVGIAPDRLPTIFEAFEQAEGGTARRFGGTGLGLAISSSLAQLLGYRIAARSEPGVGSTFSVRFGTEPAEAPRAPEPPAAPALESLTLTPAEGSEFADRLVLVVDDDPDSRFVLAEAITELGCEILAASSGEQGIELARQIRPDLITLDLIMPGGMNGWDTLRALQDDPDLARIPVVVVSVVAEENRGTLLGPVALLGKPPLRDELEPALRRGLATVYRARLKAPPAA